ncbi:MAG: hypothetical protein ACI30A_04875 [Paludibacteraceae bacterium]
MDIEEQVNTIERALGERMINHALVIVRQWVAELGASIYIGRIEHLEQNYQCIFDYYLSTDDPERENLLDQLTGDTFRLVDEVYADLRVKRGLSPEMHGFNGDNPQSVMRYFSSCVHLQQEDFDWLRECFSDPSRSAIALIALAAVGQNLRECFSEDALRCLIEAIDSDNNVIANQALATSILLLAHYDVRVDFFPELEDAFANVLGDGEHAFETMCALIRSSKANLRDMLASGEISTEDLPEPLRDLLGMAGDDGNKLGEIVSWMPETENEYMAGIVAILPDTWVYASIMGDDPMRLHKVQMLYLSIGKMDMLWEQTEEAEQWLVQRLCTDKATPIDYINYGHCCFLRGDRMMAYENYREARLRCKSAKSFFALFRPDRHYLVEHGIPLEQVYLMEDQLLRITEG